MNFFGGSFGSKRGVQMAHTQFSYTGAFLNHYIRKFETIDLCSGYTSAT